MEATRVNAHRFGRPMHRDRRGHEGGGQLFNARGNATSRAAC